MAGMHLLLVILIILIALPMGKVVFKKLYMFSLGVLVFLVVVLYFAYYLFYGLV